MIQKQLNLNVLQMLFFLGGNGCRRFLHFPLNLNNIIDGILQLELA